MITHVTCGGDDTYPAGRILLTAGIVSIESDAAGTGGVGLRWDDGCHISKTGVLTFNDDVHEWSETFFTDVALHEVGHALGLG